VTTKTTAVCKEYVSWDSWHGGPCGRRVKSDGLCGIHLRARENRKLRDEAGKQRTVVNARNYARAQAAADALTRTYGIKAQPHYAQGLGSRPGSYTGYVVIDGDAVLTALANPAHHDESR